jgi:hypothetical protein
MGVPLKTEKRRSHISVSSLRSWVRRAEGYWGTRHLKLCRQVPVKPRRPPSLRLICEVFSVHVIARPSDETLKALPMLIKSAKPKA